MKSLSGIKANFQVEGRRLWYDLDRDCQAFYCRILVSGFQLYANFDNKLLGINQSLNHYALYQSQRLQRVFSFVELA